MDKDRIIKMGLASGLEFKPLEDGTMGFRPYIFKLVDMVESAVSHDYEVERKKNQATIDALRERVTAQASEIVNLRRAIAGACEILDKEVFNG